MIAAVIGGRPDDFWGHRFHGGCDGGPCQSVWCGLSISDRDINRHLADYDWLVPTWEAYSYVAKVRDGGVCEWIGYRDFPRAAESV